MLEDGSDLTTEPPDPACLLRYQLYRDAIAAEATWSAQRTTWLVTANAFLATALAIMGQQSVHLVPEAYRLRWMLPLAAIVINVGTLAMLCAAERVTILRFREYDDSGSSKEPHLLGTRRMHWVGALVPMVFAAVLTGGWVFIALA